MSRFRRILLNWYRSESSVKRFFSRLIYPSYIMFYTFFLTNLKDTKIRSKEMKKLGMIKHSTLVCLDMLFWYLFFGYFPSTYATYQFYRISFFKRLTFMSTLEHGLFARSFNINGNVGILTNKNLTYEYLKELFGREQIIIQHESDFPLFKAFVEKHHKFFYKPLVGTWGKGAGLSSIEHIDITEFFHNLIQSGSYVIEELIVQCKELSSLHPSSVNTIRVVTLKTQNGVEILFGALRCGRGGGIVDNGASGGIFIPFSITTGRLLKQGFDEKGRRFEKHPDTHIKFEGFQIPRYEDVCSLAIHAAEKLKGLNYIGWDIAISNDKVMLVEGNNWPTLLILETLHETGFKKELREIARTGSVPESFKIKRKEIY